MKFLVTAIPNRPIPPEMGAALWQAATAWTEERIADGRIECNYVFAQTGGMAIIEVDSHEQVFDELMGYPLSGFFKWEVAALADWRHSYETLIALYQGLAG
jgi:hypothetical protein